MSEKDHRLDIKDVLEGSEKDLQTIARIYLGDAPFTEYVGERPHWEHGEVERRDIDKGRRGPDNIVVLSTLRELDLDEGRDLMREIISQHAPDIIYYEKARGDDWGTNGSLWWYPPEGKGKVQILISCYIYDHEGGIFPKMEGQSTPYNDPGPYGYEVHETSSVMFGSGFFRKIKKEG